MSGNKVERIDYGKKRLHRFSQKYFDDGNYISALRFANMEAELYGKDADLFLLYSDIYENMGLQSSAIKELFQYIDVCYPEDLPDIYEGLGLNYLNLGNESQAAYYYNKLIDVDDTLTAENHAEIANYFRKDSKPKFKFVYPPKLADYENELKEGTALLKNGNLKEAIKVLSSIYEGSKEYPSAMESKAIAYLLSEQSDEAEKTCLKLIEKYPENIEALATLAAVYTEQGRRDESKDIALKLIKIKASTLEEKYKIATVTCENDLHAEALNIFCEIEKELPYDGNLMYFKAVSAYKSGNIELCTRSFEKLLTVYPDAKVAEYYLRAVREFENNEGKKPELSYFYRVPETERLVRYHELASVTKFTKDEAIVLGVMFEQKGYFKWCFDEMDGAETELQYLASTVAVYCNRIDFIREVLLDQDVKDDLKIEILRQLYELNQDDYFGVVLCNIYKELHVQKLKIGNKKHKLFIDAYSLLASKFAIIKEEYGNKIRSEFENLYQIFNINNAWDITNNPKVLACVVYIKSNLKELGRDIKTVSNIFEAKQDKVESILDLQEKITTNEGKNYEFD